MYAIFNANQMQWGYGEFYRTPQEAEKELRDFFKGLRVDFKKFDIYPVPIYEAE